MNSGVRERPREEKRSPPFRDTGAIGLHRHRPAAMPPRPLPTAQPPTPLHRTHKAWEPHWNQHLISTLNQPDNFKQRTREEAIYAALHSAHCRAAEPYAARQSKPAPAPPFSQKGTDTESAPPAHHHQPKLSTPDGRSAISGQIRHHSPRPSDCRHLAHRQLLG